VFGFSELAGRGVGLQIGEKSRQFRKTEHPTPDALSIMRIVVNHLTRMRHGHICVAGLNLANGQHIRPLPRTELLYRDLAAHGGLFEIGAVLDLGWTKFIGKPPEVEDHEFWRKNAHPVDELPSAKFWSLLKADAKPTLIDIFGPDLQAVGHDRAAVDAGHGRVSLGTLLVTKQPPELVIEPHTPRDRIRLRLKTGRIPLSVPVTDIRLYGLDHMTPDPAAVERTQDRLRTSADVILTGGLSRAYADWLSDQPERHWLQVNNLHFVKDPYWRLPVGPDPMSAE